MSTPLARRRSNRWFALVCLTACLAAGCTRTGKGSENQDSSGSGGSTTTAPPCEEAALTTVPWTSACSGGASLRADTTATSTIREADGSFRMYYMEGAAPGRIMTAVAGSTDGCAFAFADAADTGIPTDREHPLSNPSVIKLASGTYVMLYEKAGGEPRLYRATATDGVTFTVQPGGETDGAVLVANSVERGFVSVPDMIEISGTLWVYYVAGGTGIARASSANAGATWSAHSPVMISGTGMMTADQFADPDILMNACGTLRLFFAYSRDGIFGSGGIRSALSSDGGATFSGGTGSYVSATSSGNTIDPDVVLGTDGTFRMFYGRDVSGSHSLHGATYP